METWGGDVSAWSFQGFHRYSSDQHWHVPHFEKMLYDQGQLAATYSRAFQVQPAAGGVSLSTLSAGWGELAWFGDQLPSLLPKTWPIPWAWSGPNSPFHLLEFIQKCCTNS